MSLHPDARRFLDGTAGNPELDTRTPAQNRAANAATTHLTGTPVELDHVEEMDLGGVPVRVYHPCISDDLSPVFVFFHGGGWVVGDLDTYDSVCRDIAVASGMTCISVGYRRAPEHPFPAALDDARAVLQSLLSAQSGLSIDPRRIAVGGDSAGGNLAAVLAQEQRSRIAMQVLLYPVMDLSTFDTGSHRAFAEGYFLTRRRLDYFYEAYGAGHDRTDPSLSPGLCSDLTGLPPMLMITAEYDPLHDEGDAYARAASEAGNEVTTVCFRGQVHPFINMGGIISDARVARRLIGSELKAGLDK